MINWQTSTPRFAANIRFVTSAEWDQLRFDSKQGDHEVGKDCGWYAGDGDQFVLSRRTFTDSVGPCVTGGLSGSPVVEPYPKDTTFAAQFHLLPKYNADPVARRVIGFRVRETLDALKPMLEGFVFGSRAYPTSIELAQTMVATVASAVGHTPTHFIHQASDTSTSVGFDGNHNTWFVLTQNDANPKGLQSVEGIKQAFKRRFVAPTDKVFIGLESTEPIDKTLLDGRDP